MEYLLLKTEQAKELEIGWKVKGREGKQSNN